MTGKKFKPNEIPKEIQVTLKPKGIYETIVKPNSNTSSKVYLPEGWKHQKVWVVLIE